MPRFSRIPRSPRPPGSTRGIQGLRCHPDLQDPQGRPGPQDFPSRSRADPAAPCRRLGAHRWCRNHPVPPWCQAQTGRCTRSTGPPSPLAERERRQVISPASSSWPASPASSPSARSLLLTGRSRRMFHHDPLISAKGISNRIPGLRRVDTRGVPTYTWLLGLLLKRRSLSRGALVVVRVPAYDSS